MYFIYIVHHFFVFVFFWTFPEQPNSRLFPVFVTSRNPVTAQPTYSLWNTVSQVASSVSLKYSKKWQINVSYWLHVCRTTKQMQLPPKRRHLAPPNGDILTPGQAILLLVMQDICTMCTNDKRGSNKRILASTNSHHARHATPTQPFYISSPNTVIHTILLHTLPVKYMYNIT